MTGNGKTYNPTITEGQFALKDLAPGTYTVAAMIGGKPVPSRTVKLGDGSPLDGEVTFWVLPAEPPKLPPTGSAGWPFYLTGGALVLVGAWLGRRKPEEDEVQ